MKVQPAFIGSVEEESDHQSHAKQWEYGVVSIFGGDSVTCNTVAPLPYGIDSIETCNTAP